MGDHYVADRDRGAYFWGRRRSAKICDVSLGLTYERGNQV